MTDTEGSKLQRSSRTAIVTLTLLVLATSVLVPNVQAGSQGACADGGVGEGCCHRRTDVPWARCQVVGSWADSNEVYWALFDEDNDPDDDAPWD